MRLISVCLLFVLAVSSIVCGEEFSIDRFEFDWKLAKSGDTSLILRKDEDTIRVAMLGRIHSLSMTPEEAVEAGAALAQTPEMSTKLKGSKGKSERVKAGKHIVSFQTTDEGSFFVSLRRDEQFSISSVILNREDAIAFAPYLKKAKAMAEHLDKAVQPNAKAAVPQDPVEAKKAAETAKANAERAQADALKAKADADRAKAEAEKLTAESAIITAKRDAAKAADELAAAGIKKLDLAKQMLKANKSGTATVEKRLKEIVELYPNTPAADEAGEMLKKLK